jgi:hypothetical protein
VVEMLTELTGPHPLNRRVTCLRPRIWPHLLRLATNGHGGQAPTGGKVTVRIAGQETDPNLGDRNIHF